MPSRLEVLKDVLQVAVESGAERVGRVTTVVTGAVGEVTREVGGWLSDIFEVVEAAKQAPKSSSAASTAESGGEAE